MPRSPDPGGASGDVETFREGGGGRTPIAPEILQTPWLDATAEDVGSARSIARLTESHDGCRWICRGLKMNDHTCCFR